MTRKSPPPKRKNRAIQLGDVVDGMLDPVLRRRGFAGREIIANWQVIAPSPWNAATMPDKMVWPRKGRPDPEGAVLYLRCIESYKVMLAHDAPQIVGAINRYFGYHLVRSVRLSLNPLSLPAAASASKPAPSRVALARIEKETASVSNPELRAALDRLGRGVLGKG
ncbi:DUF721 domain-containing protein [Pelagibacterium lacus]|uniref:DUF721 domain-containing protein n=1 Tax=Pelagibacterium lacus TaxID=2282655 RepID=A0A369W7D3_9HYPH|nr:DciA family protein [Pelagibacterium lacus]RDE10604.1 DUF721 domain-containing protein [Pelagibacterium lacus]